MPTKMHRCANIAEKCWREFDEDSFYISASGKKFCSDTCLSAYAVQARLFDAAANPFAERRYIRRMAG